MKKILLITATVIVLAGIAVFVIYKYVSKEKPQAEFVDQKPDVQLRAKRLWTDYSMNKDIADPKYTGKIIEIEGQIMRVEEKEGKVIVVFAYRKGATSDEGIRVTMLPQFNRAAKGINPFKNIKIKGHCTGYDGIDVLMEDGSIVGLK
jgi:hypothetical protein